MKKLILLSTIALFAFNIQAQSKFETKLDSIIKDIELADKNKNDADKLIKILKELIKQQANISVSVDSLKKDKSDNELKLLVYNNQIQILCRDLLEYKNYLKKIENVNDSILKKYKPPLCDKSEDQVEENEVTEETNEADETDESKDTFYIIGDNKPISSDSLFTTETQKTVVLDAFGAKSEANLGRFEIPENNKVILFYIKNKDSAKGFLNSLSNKNDLIQEIKRKSNNKSEKDSFSKKKKSTTKSSLHNKYVTLKSIQSNSSDKFAPIPFQARFKSISVELREGSIVDARLILETNNAHFYFEITTPISILNFTRKVGMRNRLKYSHYVSKNTTVYDEELLKLLEVKFIDVLDYHPNAGNNYVPDNMSYFFPSETKEETASKKEKEYIIVNNTRLQNVLDLRAYTDALGLFSDEANGLFQIEGKADFFIHPFSFPKTALYYLKKITPYVRYSRLDDDEDFLTTTLDTISNIYKFDNQKIELLQRSNLEMGLDLNFINFRMFKESQFWASIYIPLSYNVTPIMTKDDEDPINLQTIGYGIAGDIELKRYNNFGLNIGGEFKGYSYIGNFENIMLEEPSHLKTLSMNAEVYYYPDSKKSQSIFLRMKSIRDLTNGKDSYFQLQFGYRFTISVGSVKANN